MSDPVTRLNAALEGRYRIESELGEGGMATVYLAEDLKHWRKVALKVLKPELAAVVGGERFLAEIKTTANLQHPHILALFDSGAADSFLFYVMPYVEGESLRERLDREHQLPVDDAVRMATNVAEALDYAHRQGVIHRDIKPANILLQDGKPVISDFGIALAVSAGGGGRLTETGLSLGTPHYMSPEQATGDLNVGPATDVYALGCVLFEMLVGEPPFTGSTPQAILGKIIVGKLASAREERSAVPLNVDAAIRKALEKLPADRFTAAQDLAGALREPAFAHGEPMASGLAVTGRPWKTVSIVLGALTLLLGFGFGQSLLRSERSRPVSRISVDLAPEQGFHPERGDFDISDDGSLFVYRGVGDAGEPFLWARRWEELEAVPIPGTEWATRPRISPDGREVVFQAFSSIRVVPIEGGISRTLVSQDSDTPNWSPDGAWVYYHGQGEGLSRIPSGGGAAEIVTEVDRLSGDVTHYHPEVLPGDRLLYQVQGPDGDRVQAMDLGSGEVRDVTSGRYPIYSSTGHLVYQSASEPTLLAAPFDVARLEFTGPAVLLAGNLLRVGIGAAANVALSEEGTLVYRAGQATASVPVFVGRDGSEVLLDESLTGPIEAPAFSPDGRRVALQRQVEGGPEDIWLYDLDQRTITRLTFGSGRNLQPFWSPDGQEVGFSSDRDGFFALYSRPADLSSEVRLRVSDPNDGLYEGRWTPDGRWLVFRRGSVSTTGAMDLMYSAPDTDSLPVTILDTPASETTPSLSPNGSWLAYTSDQSGRPEVYVRPFPGPGGQSRVSLGGGHNPNWAQSGREILYWALDGGFRVATVRTDPGFEVESRGEVDAPPLFIESGIRHWDLTPDAQRFLAIGLPTVDRQLILVQSFHEELKRLIPN